MSDIKQIAIKALTAWSGCRSITGDLDENACSEASKLESILFRAIDKIESTNSDLQRKLDEALALIEQSRKQEPIAYIVQDQKTLRPVLCFTKETTIDYSEHISTKEPIPLYLSTNAIQEGYVMVPKQMTDAMFDAGNVYTLNRSTLARIWDVVLSAT